MERGRNQLLAVRVNGRRENKTCLVNKGKVFSFCTSEKLELNQEYERRAANGESCLEVGSQTELEGVALFQCCCAGARCWLRIQELEAIRLVAACTPAKRKGGQGLNWGACVFTSPSSCAIVKVGAVGEDGCVYRPAARFTSSKTRV